MLDDKCIFYSAVVDHLKGSIVASRISRCCCSAKLYAFARLFEPQNNVAFLYL